MLISADNISEYTGGKNVSYNVPPMPSLEALVEKTRREAKERLSFKFSFLKAVRREKDLRQELEAEIERERLNQKDFDRMIDNVPAGFALAPVFYAPPPEEATRYDYMGKKEGHSFRKSARREFNERVLPLYLNHIAIHHAPELSALGMCATGISHMENYKWPADAAGRDYNITIDHIIEIGGSGRLAIDADYDPGRPRIYTDIYGKPMRAEKTARVNHCGNLVVLTHALHDYKNRLNDLQNIDAREWRQRKWTIMMVPVRNEAWSGFVCPPQPRPIQALSSDQYKVYGRGGNYKTRWKPSYELAVRMGLKRPKEEAPPSESGIIALCEPEVVDLIAGAKAIISLGENKSAVSLENNKSAVSLADAKIAEDGVKHRLDVDASRDAADGAQGKAQVLGRKFGVGGP